MQIELWGRMLLCGMCGKLCRSKMTFGIAGYRVLCDEHARPFRALLLNPKGSQS